MRRNSGRRAAACLAVLAVAVSGCGQLVRGSGSYSTSKSNVADADTPIKNLPDGKKTDVDVIAGNAIADIETYWKQTFPGVFNGKQYQSPQGGYYSVDPTQNVSGIPCVDSASEIQGNAFYCPAKDIVAWDRVDLFPTLKKEFSDFLIAMVLAHEWGHVIQTKSGVDPDRTIVRETQADCYAGGWTKWALAGNAPHFQIDQTELDTALAGYLLFRDPVGSDANDQDAHGSGFDRISAFQEGFEQGPQHCATFDDNRKFTEITFTSQDDASRGGNLPLDDQGQNEGAITLGLQDLAGTWPTLAQQLGAGGSFQKPKVQQADEGSATCDGGKVDQGVFYCASANTVYYSREALGKVSANTKDSDYAPMTLLGVAYAQAVLKQAGKDITGHDGLAAAICLDGAYTSDAANRQPGNQDTPLTLSPGDLDEAIQAMLFYTGTSAFFGTNGTSGFERVSDYRQGFNDPKSCITG